MTDVFFGKSAFPSKAVSTKVPKKSKTRKLTDQEKKKRAKEIKKQVRKEAEKKAQRKEKRLLKKEFKDEYIDYIVDEPGLYGNKLSKEEMKKIRKRLEDKYNFTETKSKKTRKPKKENLEEFIKKFEKHYKQEYSDQDLYGKYGSVKYSRKVKNALKEEISQIEKEDQDAYARLEQLIEMYIQEWIKLAPQSFNETLEIGRVCGSACFLKPSTGEYPICPKCGPSECYCAPVCSGLYNANVLSERRGDLQVQQRARALGYDIGCDWALLIQAYFEHAHKR